MVPAHGRLAMVVSPGRHGDVRRRVRQFLLPLWNVYAFFVTYANASGFDPLDGEDVPVGQRPLLDRWVLSQLSRTEAAARDGLEAYDATGAGRRIAEFVDDLSNWYVRRARRRFWDPAGEGDDVRAAFLTLHACLVSLSQLLAPFTPFVAETLWRNLAAGRDGAPDSVHLSDYPTPDEHRVEPSLDDAMAAVRQVVELGRRVRTETKVRVRQPLLEAVVHYAGPRGPRAVARSRRRGAERQAGAVRGVRRATRPVARQAELQGPRPPARTRGQGGGDGARAGRRVARRARPRRPRAGRPGDRTGRARAFGCRPRPGVRGGWGSRATAASPSRSSSS